MLNFFFYGTLLEPEVQRLVLQRDVPSENVVPATLVGYRRYMVLNASYPAVVRQPGAEIDGIVMIGLDALDAARLSIFEGDGYVAANCSVKITEDESGKDRPTQAWVFIASDRMPLTKADWSLKTWRVAHMGQILEIANNRLGVRGDDNVAVQERIWRARLKTG
ncbi:MAG: gamma-glutamylcyclotransferase [Alphaproteobacteria bacterium]|nr:gamma-glutamylcyclotransferase [Alphaproteobacteria bacterium]